MDMFSGIASYASEQASANVGQKFAVAALAQQQDQAKLAGDAALKLLESASLVPGKGQRLDVYA